MLERQVGGVLPDNIVNELPYQENVTAQVEQLLRIVRGMRTIDQLEQDELNMGREVLTTARDFSNDIADDAPTVFRLITSQLEDGEPVLTCHTFEYQGIMGWEFESSVLQNLNEIQDDQITAYITPESVAAFLAEASETQDNHIACVQAIIAARNIFPAIDVTACLNNMIDSPHPVAKSLVGHEFFVCAMSSDSAEEQQDYLEAAIRQYHGVEGPEASDYLMKSVALLCAPNASMDDPSAVIRAALKLNADDDVVDVLRGGSADELIGRIAEARAPQQASRANASGGGMFGVDSPNADSQSPAPSREEVREKREEWLNKNFGGPK